MAGNQSRYEWQFKQRLTSGGLNLQTSYLARNTSEAMRFLAGGTDSETFGQTGIIRGFMVSAVPGTLKLTVGPGLGHFFRADASEPDSKAKWMELIASKEVTTTAGDAANPRWDVVEARPATIDGTPEIIDFFNPADNTFSPAVVSVQKLAQASVRVRQGTPNANPKLLAGDPDWIPLAYQYVPATTLALSVEQTMHCRPILTPRHGVTPDNINNTNLTQFGENQNISGGGWRIAADGAEGFLATAMAGTFPLGGRPFYIPGGTFVNISATGNYVGGGLPLASTLVYAYVAPPPYPSGYAATLAPREMFILDVTIPNLAATIPPGIRGGIVVIAPSAPANLDNPLGQRGTPITAHSFTDNFWGAFDLKRSDMLYIGAAYYDFAVPGLVTQRVVGNWIAPKNKTGVQFDGDLPINAPAVYNLWTAYTDPMAFPPTARRLAMQCLAVLDAGDGLRVELEDEWTGNGTTGGIRADISNTSAVTKAVSREFDVQVTSTGNITISAAAKNGGVTAAALITRAYEDRILAMR